MATKNKALQKRKICTCCKQEKPLSKFYMSKSPLFALDGKVGICIECVKEFSLNNETGEIDEVKFKNILRQIDKPYYKDNLQSAINQFSKEHSYVPEEEIKYHGQEIVSLYMKNLNSLRQLSNKSYADSESEGFIQKHSTVLKTGDDVKHVKRTKETKVTVELKDEDFELTDDIIQLFGEGYTKTEYRKMYKKYEKLKLNYSLQTNLHQEALATYVRFKVKEEDATARGDVDEAKKWYDAAQNAAANGKLTPKQLSEADLQGGINSFSEIFKAVEQAVDVIPILPRFKYRPNDALDFNIWCYINYARDLQGLPQCDYEDVYKFYDKKKEEYLEQYGDPYGIFDDEPDASIRENIKKFITLPNDYGDGDE